MNSEMFQAIIELVKQGGTAAVWIAVLHYVVILMKYTFIFSGVMWGVKRLHDCIIKISDEGHIECMKRISKENKNE